jgi:hypothetical protein
LLFLYKKSKYFFTKQSIFEKQKFILSIMFAFLLAALPARASEIEPRSYINTPVGINFFIAGYSYLNGSVVTEDSSPIKDAKLAVNAEALTYIRTFDVLGKPAKFTIIMPYSELTGSALFNGISYDRKISGLNDPRFGFSVNFYGAPVLTPQEFASYQQDVIIGASVQISPPLGQYDDTKLVNLGNNRWFVRPDIGISKAWGPVTLEFSTGVFFFTKNNDYLRGKTLEQDPISTAQLHLTYNFSSGAWAALSATYDHGGRTTTNGVSNDDLMNNMRVGATFAYPINRNNSIKLYLTNSLHTSVGINAYLIGVVWQCRWGNGL